MPKRIRPDLSYANVMSTVAVFVALGGGAVAATRLTGPDGRISGCVSRSGQLTVLKPGKRCGKGRTKIVWSQQGPVGARGTTGSAGPQGATGEHGARGPAGPADGPAGGALAGSYPNPTLACPAGLVLQSGVCFERSVRPAATWDGAAVTCGAAGRRLASPDELFALAGRSDVALTTYEWTGTSFQAESGGATVLAATTVLKVPPGPSQGPHLGRQSAFDPLVYRCAVNAGSG